MKFNQTKLAICAVALGACLSAQAQFSTDIRTAVDAGTAIQTNRVFQNGFLTLNTNTPSPLASVIWFVSDTGNNGVNLTGSGGTGPGNVLNPDDILLWVDTIDGAAAGSRPGQYQRLGVSIASTNVSYFPIYAYIWNFTNSTGQLPQPSGNTTGAGVTSPQPGSQFDVFNIGIRTPDYANGFSTTTWFISQNMFADHYTVGVVPEPSTIALAGLGLVGLICYRRFRK